MTEKSDTSAWYGQIQYKIYRGPMSLWRSNSESYKITKGISNIYRCLYLGSWIQSRVLIYLLNILYTLVLHANRRMKKEKDSYDSDLSVYQPAVHFGNLENNFHLQAETCRILTQASELPQHFFLWAVSKWHAKSSVSFKIMFVKQIVFVSYIATNFLCITGQIDKVAWCYVSICSQLSSMLQSMLQKKYV